LLYQLSYVGVKKGRREHAIRAEGRKQRAWIKTLAPPRMLD
jgi:hypothetical protein